LVFLNATKNISHKDSQTITKLTGKETFKGFSA
jgi:hypothetical protein